MGTIWSWQQVQGDVHQKKGRKSRRSGRPSILPLHTRNHFYMGARDRKLRHSAGGQGVGWSNSPITPSRTLLAYLITAGKKKKTIGMIRSRHLEVKVAAHPRRLNGKLYQAGGAYKRGGLLPQAGWKWKIPTIIQDVMEHRWEVDNPGQWNSLITEMGGFAEDQLIIVPSNTEMLGNVLRPSSGSNSRGSGRRGNWAGEFTWRNHLIWHGRVSLSMLEKCKMKYGKTWEKYQCLKALFIMGVFFFIWILAAS